MTDKEDPHFLDMEDGPTLLDEDEPVGIQVCRYSLRHAMEGVPAVTEIDCGPVGIVPACKACRGFYVRMSR